MVRAHVRTCARVFLGLFGRCARVHARAGVHARVRMYMCVCVHMRVQVCNLCFAAAARCRRFPQALHLSEKATHALQTGP